MVKKLPVKPVSKANGTALVTREAPEERSIGRYEDVNAPIINEEQFRILYTKTPEHAVRTREGRGGRMFKYIPHGYTTDRLNKAFGFAWSFQLLPISNGERFMLQVYEETTGKGAKQVRDVAVYGELTVQIYDADQTLVTTVTKGGMGSQRWEMGTEFGDALKGATSDAKKFCAKELGIGLDLYYDDDAAIEQHEVRARQAEELARELDAFNAPVWADKARAMKAQKMSSVGVVNKLAEDGFTVTIADVNKWTAHA